VVGHVGSVEVLPGIADLVHVFSFHPQKHFRLVTGGQLDQIVSCDGFFQLFLTDIGICGYDPLSQRLGALLLDDGSVGSVAVFRDGCLKLPCDSGGRFSQASKAAFSDCLW
jgi:hypothetical protein